MKNLNIAAWMDDDFLEDMPFKELLSPSERIGDGHPDNRGDCFAANRLLSKKLNELGHKIHTQDFYIERNIVPDLVIYFDIPTVKTKERINFWPNIKKILIIQECEVIRPTNWIDNTKKNFDVIFTWNNQLVDNKSFFWFPTIHGYKQTELPIKTGISHKIKLATLISSNKVSTHKLELYSERKKVIDWYYKNAFDDFDLYGYDWDKIVIRKPRPLKIINRLKIKRKNFKIEYKFYKGEILDKRKTLEKYKFCYAFENAIDIDGYITEKIFDCFIAGTIPIYLGSNSINKLVPEDCFINARNFKSIDQIHSYIDRLNVNEYLCMQNNISEFLNTEISMNFTDVGYVNKILPKILAISNEIK